MKPAPIERPTRLSVPGFGSYVADKEIEFPVGIQTCRRVQAPVFWSLASYLRRVDGTGS